MKKIFQTLLLFILAISASFTGNAQKGFAGHILYQIDYDGLGENAAMKSMLPSEMKFILKNNKSRSELKTGMGNQITIFDSESKTIVNLLNIMGQKVAIKKSLGEIELERTKYSNLRVSISDETKNIAGYNCKKALIEVNAEDFGGLTTFTVFYTEELGNTGINYSDPLFNKINGVMLQYEVSTRGLLMKFSASEVKTEDVPDSAFAIPSDYKEMTQDELKKMFGSF
ncbi:MAG: DUF4412 domain-containing protein [Bacteroidetes bacterium]|nr:DUF4412 domain-containing protein [Bacteroidota bacterium]